MSTWTSPQSSVGISASRRSISASPVETSWMTAAWPASRSRSTERISDGVFIEVSRWPKKRCLALSKAERAADFAVQRAGLARDVGGAHRRVEIVVNDREGAGVGVVDADLLGRELVFDKLVFDAFVGESERHNDQAP